MRRRKRSRLIIGLFSDEKSGFVEWHCVRGNSKLRSLLERNDPMATNGILCTVLVSYLVRSVEHTQQCNKHNLMEQGGCSAVSLPTTKDHIIAPYVHRGAYDGIFVIELIDRQYGRRSLKHR